MISIYMSILAGFVGLLAALILARKVVTFRAGQKLRKRVKINKSD